MAKKLEVRVVQLEDGQRAIMDTLAKMDEKLDGIDHVVRGNGAPGLSTKIETQGQRLKALEENKKSWRELTVLIVSGGAIALLTAVVQHFVR